MKYFGVADLGVFVREVFIIGLSMIWNIDAYMLKEAEEIKKARRAQAVTQAQQQPKQAPSQPQTQAQPSQKKHK